MLLMLFLCLTIETGFSYTNPDSTVFIEKIESSTNLMDKIKAQGEYAYFILVYQDDFFRATNLYLEAINLAGSSFKEPVEFQAFYQYLNNMKVGYVDVYPRFDWAMDHFENLVDKENFRLGKKLLDIWHWQILHGLMENLP